MPDQRFAQILSEMQALHDSKSADYSPGEDEYANYRSEDFGVAPWINVLLRMNDKMCRLKTFARSGILKNEPADREFIDVAVQAVIALILLREGACHAKELERPRLSDHCGSD